MQTKLVSVIATGTGCGIWCTPVHDAATNRGCEDSVLLLSPATVKIRFSEPWTSATSTTTVIFGAVQVESQKLIVPLGCNPLLLLLREHAVLISALRPEHRRRGRRRFFHPRQLLDHIPPVPTTAVCACPTEFRNYI
jgi:hypothetical protein